jgi:hypothetical protein
MKTLRKPKAKIGSRQVKKHYEVESDKYELSAAELKKTIAKLQAGTFTFDTAEGIRFDGRPISDLLNYVWNRKPADNHRVRCEQQRGSLRRVWIETYKEKVPVPGGSIRTETNQRVNLSNADRIMRAAAKELGGPLPVYSTERQEFTARIKHYGKTVRLAVCVDLARNVGPHKRYFLEVEIEMPITTPLPLAGRTKQLCQKFARDLIGKNGRKRQAVGSYRAMCFAEYDRVKR